MAASKQKYSAAEAASMISNWLAESADESESEIEHSDSSEDEEEVILRDEIEAENVFEGEQDTPPVVADTQTAADPPQPVVVGTQPAAKKAKRNTKVVVDQIPEVWNFLDDNYDDQRMHNFRFIPNKIPGLQLDLGEQNSPIEFFFELFSDDVQLDLVNMINEFAVSKIQQNNPPKRRSLYSRWKPINHYELIKFLAVCIAMGLDRKPSIKDYWSLERAFYSPFYHDLFPRDRFESIMHTMLHVSPTEAVSKAKIEPFINKLVENFKKAYYPYQDVSIDEMVIKWKGRSKYKMYNPMKPEKYHIKTFGLCCATTGYAYSILPYFGKETDYSETMSECGASEKVFEYLLRPLGAGHHIFADRYYTTKILIEYLTSNNFYYTGTLQANRKGFPVDIKQSKLAHMQHKFWRSETSGILLVMWKDKAKKPVIMVSTHGEQGISMVEMKKTKKIVAKPTIINTYNVSMNGCDRLDQFVSYY